MQTRKEKEELESELAEMAKRQKVVVFSNFHGLSVAAQQAFRRALRKEDAEVKIAKKTILRRAFESIGLPFPVADFKGEVAVVFGYGDEIAPARVVAKFGKENPDSFKTIGGILGGRALEAKSVLALAKLPGKRELLSQLVGILSAPIRNLMNVLNGNQRKLVTALAAIAEKK